jgi:hypothetical protein
MLPTMNIVSQPSSAVAAPATPSRGLIVCYAALLVASYVYVAQPGGPIWIPGAELPWLIADVILLRLMLRGSTRAIAISAALDAVALLAIAGTEPFHTQPGFITLMSLLTARLSILVIIWNHRKTTRTPGDPVSIL